jgi:hypothetical protein
MQRSEEETKPELSKNTVIMTLDQLENFIAIAEGKTISAVSKEFYITQPTLTVRLQNLEQELGFKLFERRQSRYGAGPLTKAGEKFSDYARAAIKAIKKGRLLGLQVIEEETREKQWENIVEWAASMGWYYIPTTRNWVDEATYLTKVTKRKKAS